MTFPAETALMTENAPSFVMRPTGSCSRSTSAAYTRAEDPFHGPAAVIPIGVLEVQLLSKAHIGNRPR